MRMGMEIVRNNAGKKRAAAVRTSERQFQGDVRAAKNLAIRVEEVIQRIGEPWICDGERGAEEFGDAAPHLCPEYGRDHFAAASARSSFGTCAAFRLSNSRHT